MRQLMVFILLMLGWGTQAQTAFPEGWEGVWKGTLDINFTNGKQMDVVMELHIHAKTDTSWQWKIVYLTDSSKDERDYTLNKVKNSPHYELDEHNGIGLHLSSINNGMYSSFEVAGSELMIFYELIGEELVFRTISSGNGVVSGGIDDIPEVTSRKTNVSQKAILKKVKD